VAPDEASPLGLLAGGRARWLRFRAGNAQAWGWAATCLSPARGGPLGFPPLAAGFPLPSAAVRWPTGLERLLGRAVPPNGTALVLRHAVSGNDDPMGWQALSGVRHRLIGGYAIVPAPPTGSGSYQAPPPRVAVALTTGIVHPAGFGVVEPDFRPGGQPCLELRGLVRRRGVAVVALWQLTPASRRVAGPRPHGSVAMPRRSTARASPASPARVPPVPCERSAPQRPAGGASPWAATRPASPCSSSPLLPTGGRWRCPEGPEGWSGSEPASTGPPPPGPDGDRHHRPLVPSIGATRGRHDHHTVLTSEPIDTAHLGHPPGTMRQCLLESRSSVPAMSG